MNDYLIQTVAGITVAVIMLVIQAAIAGRQRRANANDSVRMRGPVVDISGTNSGTIDASVTQVDRSTRVEEIINLHINQSTRQAGHTSSSSSPSDDFWATTFVAGIAAIIVASTFLHIHRSVLFVSAFAGAALCLSFVALVWKTKAMGARLSIATVPIINFLTAISTYGSAFAAVKSAKWQGITVAEMSESVGPYDLTEPGLSGMTAAFGNDVSRFLDVYGVQGLLFPLSLAGGLVISLVLLASSFGVFLRWNAHLAYAHAENGGSKTRLKLARGFATCQEPNNVWPTVVLAIMSALLSWQTFYFFSGFAANTAI